MCVTPPSPLPEPLISYRWYLPPEYFSIHLLKTRTFFHFTKIGWTHAGNLISIQCYCLIYYPYSAPCSCPNHVVCCSFKKTQDPIGEPHCAFSSLACFHLHHCPSSAFQFVLLFLFRPWRFWRVKAGFSQQVSWLGLAVVLASRLCIVGQDDILPRCRIFMHPSRRQHDVTLSLCWWQVWSCGSGGIRQKSPFFLSWLTRKLWSDTL